MCVWITSEKREGTVQLEDVLNKRRQQQRHGADEATGSGNSAVAEAIDEHTGQRRDSHHHAVGGRANPS